MTDKSTVRFFVRDESGKRHGFTIDPDSHLIRFTGGGLQSVPPMWDTGHYGFSHGGQLYQAACRRVWKWQENRRSQETKTAQRARRRFETECSS